MCRNWIILLRSVKLQRVWEWKLGRLWDIREKTNLENVGIQEEFHASGIEGMSNKIMEENLHIWRQSQLLSNKIIEENHIWRRSQPLLSNKSIEENLHIWRWSHPLSHKRQTEHQIDRAFISYTQKHRHLQQRALKTAGEKGHVLHGSRPIKIALFNRKR